MKAVVAIQFSIAMALRMAPTHSNLYNQNNNLYATSTEEQAKSGLGWDSHKAIEMIPDTLVRTIDGNDSMRRKFEVLCRTSQVHIFFSKLFTESTYLYM
jgi:peptide methionine sulfoxide reductase MsrB